MICFDTEIKPLFSRYDRDQMRFAFDLWDYADVRSNAVLILERLQTGDMPCDDSWPAVHVELFRRWIEEGMQP